MSSGPMGAGNGAGVGGVPDMHIRHDTHEYGQQHYYNRHNQPQESRHHHRHQRGHQPSAGALPPPTGTSTEPAPNCTITTAVPVKLSSVLPPLSGQCLCGDFTIVISNPRPGMILCHCSHCQINSASFFGTYITAGKYINLCRN